MSDVMVVGYDLATQQPIHITAGNREDCRPRGYTGTQEIICWHCWYGDGIPAGTKVPLVVRGRDGSVVRSHFAHPKGMAPPGGHGPETVWHLDTKAVIAAWARQQPGVARVEVEHVLADWSRRADVMVTFESGQLVAIEAQFSRHTDGEWLARHADYARAGVVDVWIWANHWWADVARRAEKPVWMFDPAGQKLRTQVAEPHEHRGATAQARDVYRMHWPACPGDATRWPTFSLEDCTLDVDGIHPPAAFREELRRAPRVRPPRRRPTSGYGGDPDAEGEFNGRRVAQTMIARIREQDRQRALTLPPEERQQGRAREAERIRQLYRRRQEAARRLGHLKPIGPDSDDAEPGSAR